MTFDNHPPVDFRNAEEIASTSRDGGAYSGIGHNTYRVFQGKKLHLTHSHSSGCVSHGEFSAPTNREHLGVFDTKAELVAFLLAQPSEWWASELLTELGYEGEEA